MGLRTNALAHITEARKADKQDMIRMACRSEMKRTLVSS